jgi:hypothetical protein
MRLVVRVSAEFGWTEVLKAVPPRRERAIIWAFTEKAPDVKIIHATFAITSDDTVGFDVMPGCTLA